MGSQDTAGSVASQYVSLCTEQTLQAPNMINCQLSLVFITSDKVPAEAIMYFTIRRRFRQFCDEHGDLIWCCGVRPVVCVLFYLLSELPSPGPTSSHPPPTRQSGLGLREATRLPASSDIDNIGDRQQAQSSVSKYNMTLQLQARVTDNLNYFRGKEIFILLYTNLLYCHTHGRLFWR